MILKKVKNANIVEDLCNFAYSKNIIFVINEFNKFSRMFFRGRLHELESYPTRGEQMQREVLQFLVDCAKETEFGRKHLFNHIKSYDDYVRNVPVNDYETLKGDIDRMRLARRISFGQDW